MSDYFYSLHLLLEFWIFEKPAVKRWRVGYVVADLEDENNQ